MGRILIAGASGVVGRAMTEAFARAGWDVLAAARRPLDLPEGARFLRLDLTQPLDCTKALESAGPVTHLVYCATYEKPNLVRGWLDPDHMSVNRAMFRTCLTSVLATSPDLAHVTLMQGTKAYGAAAGFFRVPAREEDPRYPAPNYYYVQQDDMCAMQADARFGWTILRPQFVCGFAPGSAMNGLTAIGCYAAICRELGMPLRYPGGPFRVQEATDSRLLARAAIWAATTDVCRDQIYNIVNGDVFTWESLWPRIARFFGIDAGTPAPSRLARTMTDKADVWRRIAERHGLAYPDLGMLVPNWEMADNLLGLGIEPRAMLLSGIKARQHGFTDCMDTEEMFLDHLRRQQQMRVLPAYDRVQTEEPE